MLMKKRTIYIWLWLLGLLVTWGYIYNRYTSNKAAVEAEKIMMYTVGTGDVTTEVKVSATAQVSDEQSLSFGREGKIANIFVKPWDRITAGQILAELDMEEYDNNILAAELDLANARLGLSRMQNPDIALWVAQLKTQLLDAQLWLGEEQQSTNVLNQQLTNTYQAKKNQVELSLKEIELAEKSQELLKEQLENTYIQKQSQLDQALLDLDIAKKSFDLSLVSWDVSIDEQSEQTKNSLSLQEQLITSTVGSLRDSIWDLESIVDRVDLIFWVSDVDTYIYENDLSAKNTEFKKQTKLAVREANRVLWTIENEILSLDANDDIVEIKRVITSIYTKTEMITYLSNVALDAVNASVPWLDMTINDIEQLRSTLMAGRSSAIWYRAQIQSQASSITNQISADIQNSQLDISKDQQLLDQNSQSWNIAKMEQDIQLLKNDLKSFESDQELQLAQTKKQLDAQLDGLVLLQQELDGLALDNTLQQARQSNQVISQQERIWLLNQEVANITKWASMYDLQQQENIVSLSQISLDRAKDQQDTFQIVAEFDGRVRTVDIAVWEEYTFEERNYIVVENPDLVELELEVSQIDIVKISVGDPVTITLDAYPNTPITATIWARDLNPIANARWWVNYKAMIFLEPQELEIFAGMSALVTITTDQVSNVIVVPSLALIEQQGKQYVYKMIWDEYKLHQVETGISNNFQVEVVNGLEIWDIIKWSALSDEALDELGIDESSDSPFGR